MINDILIEDFIDDVRAVNTLNKLGYNTFRDLQHLSDSDIRKLPGMSGVSGAKVINALHDVKRRIRVYGFITVMGKDEKGYSININQITSICKESETEYIVRLGADKVVLDEFEMRALRDYINIYY